MKTSKTHFMFVFEIIEILFKNAFQSIICKMSDLNAFTLLVLKPVHSIPNEISKATKPCMVLGHLQAQ